MTREEAIKELSYIADEMPSMECGNWKEAIYMAIKALEQEPSSSGKPNEWIPVSERLPEEHGEYLVTDKYGRVTSGLWIGNAKRWKDVIAWMPLPEPYKAESEE